ncbi:MAG: hypothetical protein MK008_12850 [Bdellovibrionales bacterium]|nr:hypothetical protein [Bdellovibrionales bacterium]
MRIALVLILLISINSYARKPAQYEQQLVIVTKALKNKPKKEKLKIMKEFLGWMEVNNAEQMQLYIESDVSDALKEKIYENRIIYFNLKPLNDIFLTQNKIPNSKECKKIISDVKYSDRIRNTKEVSNLSPRAKQIISLLSNFCG